MSKLTLLPSTPVALQSETWQSLISENEELRAQLDEAEVEVHQLQADLIVASSKIEQLETQLTEAQSTVARLEQEVSDLKQAPFKSRRRRKSQKDTDDSGSPKQRGRKKGHTGSGRKRPTEVDHTECIPVGEVCPDCGTPFAGKMSYILSRGKFTDFEGKGPTIDNTNTSVLRIGISKPKN